MSSSHEDIARLCAAQFETATSPPASWTYAQTALTYSFGNAGRGTEVLDVLPSDVLEQPTIADIGAGNGSYLANIKNLLPGAKTIGQTATNNHPEIEGIDYVYGDIQCAETWKPNDSLKPDSVDLAVTYFTFHHLADTVGALRNVMKFLKPGGHFFIDLGYIEVPAEDTETAAAITEELQQNRGQRGLGVRVDHDDYSTVIRFNGHLRKITDDLFESLVPEVNPGHQPSHGPALPPALFYALR
jgi:SAM-dependent methyltransferase